MSEDEQLIEIMMDVFRLDRNEITDALTYNSVPGWDSVGHMTLIASLEDSFTIEFDPDDIPQMTNVRMVKDTVRKYLAKA